MRQAALEPLKKQDRVHERVALQLRAQILAGAYTPGQRLPNERDLMTMLHVSRSAVRRAMQLLEQEGLVEIRVGSGGGVFVSGATFEPVLRSFANLFALRGISPSEFLAAKSVIEPTIFARAAETIDDDQLARLRDNLVQNRQAAADGLDDRAFELAHDFHRIVAEATRNPILELVLRALVEVVSHIQTFRERPVRGWDAVLRDHEELQRALERGAAEDVHRIAQRHASSVQSAFAAQADAGHGGTYGRPIE